MSSIPNQHTFSIENTKVPGTEQVFGQKFAGTFSIRRPSLGDRQNIAVRKAAKMSAHGTANPQMISESMHLTIYIFVFLTTVATEPLPKWFDPDNIFTEEEELAVHVAWQEVSRWLEESFPG